MRISDWSSDVCSSDLNALFLFSQIWPRLGQHWSLDLGPELADRRIDFDAFDLPDSPADRYTLAAFLAAHLSFQLAAWHEIAQWYGYHTRSEEHTSELQSLMRISYAVFCLKKKNRHIISSSHATSIDTLHNLHILI